MTSTLASDKKATAQTVLFWLFITVLAIVVWLMVSHGSVTTLLILIFVFVFFGLPVGVSLVTNFATRRVDRDRLAKVTGLLDSGTVEIQIAPYGAGASAIGKFHGRKAEISINRNIRASYMRFSLAGSSRVQFQVRGRRVSKAGVGRFVPWVILFGLWLYLDIKGMRKPGSSVWSLTSVIWTSYAIVELIRGVTNYRKFGNNEFYRHSTLPVSFPGSKSLEFSSVTPATFGELIQSREIQDAVSRLIESRQIDLLSIAYRNQLWLSPPETMASTIEANYYYRRKWLELEHVQAVLSDLLVLCQDLEAIQ